MMLLRKLSDGSPNHTEPQPHLLANFPKLAIACNNLTVAIEWWAPKGLYWICGKRAYTILPNDWFRSCVLGTFRPSFFLITLRQSEKLEVSICEERIKQEKVRCPTNRRLEG
jgi:hypothetical protein